MSLVDCTFKIISHWETVRVTGLHVLGAQMMYRLPRTLPRLTAVRPELATEGPHAVGKVRHMLVVGCRLLDVAVKKAAQDTAEPGRTGSGEGLPRSTSAPGSARWAASCRSHCRRPLVACKPCMRT